MKILISLFFVILLAISPSSVKAQCGFRFSEYVLNEDTTPVTVGEIGSAYNPESLYTQSISVYPNPCTDWLVVNSDSEHTFILTDLVGKEIFRSTSNVVVFKIKPLPPGLYFIIAENGFRQKVQKI